MEFYQVVGVSVVGAFFSILFTFWYVKTLKEDMSNDLETYSKDMMASIKKELDPVILTNKRAMGIISAKSVDARQLKKAESLLSEDILSQNQLLLQGIETISPQLSEYLTSNPEQIVSLMPKLVQIAQKLGINLGNISGNPLSPSPRNPSSPHPFGSDER